MVELTVVLDGTGAWSDAPGKLLLEASSIMVTGLEAGMVSGKPSVAIRLDIMNDRAFVFAETSLMLFLQAADLLAARYGDPRGEA